MASGEMDNSLSAEVSEYITARLSGLQSEITRLQAQVNEAFTSLLEQSRGAVQTDEETAASFSEVIRAARERGIQDAAAESTHTRASSDMAILNAAVEELSQKHSQVEILNSLVNRAASFAPRVAFFVIKNDQAIGWRARGLEGTVGDDAIRQIVLPLSADTPISDVVRSKTTWSGQPGGNAEDHILIDKLGSEPPQRMTAIPLMARGRAVAALYADSAALESDAINLEALETLMRVAGMAVELSVGARAGGQQPAEAQPVAQAPPPAPVTEQPPVAEEVHVEASEAAEAEPAQASTEARPQEEAETGAQEITAEQRSAAPATSAVEGEVGAVTMVSEPVHERVEAPSHDTSTTSNQSSSPSAEQYVAPLGGARSYGRAADAAELPVEVTSDDERRLHNDARRFARLLVSEIKLYNKEKVEQGRVDGDLYQRLREDIDRSRQMYDKRVSPPVAARYDYFHQELINALAEGEPSRLGAGYPGSTV